SRMSPLKIRRYGRSMRRSLRKPWRFVELWHAAAPHHRTYTHRMRISISLTLPVVLTIAVLAESVAGLRWTAPAGWKNEGARPMRAATYMVPPAAGDRTSAECVVYFFGEGQGGSVEANMERWKGQFHTANGSTAPAQIAKRVSHGLTITTIDSSGEYSGMGGPTASEHPSVSGYRLLGAIVEGPHGNVFVKFTGPMKTIAENQKKFDQLVGSFEAEK